MPPHGGINLQNGLEHDEEISSDDMDTTRDAASAKELRTDYNSYQIAPSRKFEPGTVSGNSNLASALLAKAKFR